MTSLADLAEELSLLSSLTSAEKLLSVNTVKRFTLLIFGFPLHTIPVL